MDHNIPPCELTLADDVGSKYNLSTVFDAHSGNGTPLLHSLCTAKFVCLCRCAVFITPCILLHKTQQFYIYNVQERRRYCSSVSEGDSVKKRKGLRKCWSILLFLWCLLRSIKSSGASQDKINRHHCKASHIRYTVKFSVTERSNSPTS